VFLVELSCLILGRSKLSATSSFGKNTNHNIKDKNFIIISEILDMWNSIQVRYLERDKNQQVLERLP
jgi:hypothetical protein